jgi:predicted extracellular nuclease
MNTHSPKVFSLITIMALMLMAVPMQSALAISPDIVISQVYGGGGNSGATYTNDFIELFNRGNATVNITGWSVQYASSSGTSWQVTALSGSIAPGQYYLVQEAAGSGGTTPLPTPDASGTIAMSATNGKVALVSGATALTGACPLASAVDFVGFGTSANCFEGSGATQTLSNTTAAIRLNNGCTETDGNAADFSVGAPSPRNTTSPLNSCTTVIDPKINEFSANTVGTDVEYVEIIGSPNANYSAYTVLEIEGDSGAAVGTVDEVINLGTTDANGLYLVNLPANALENGSLSLLLVKNFTGALNNDLDTDNNGVFDTTPWDAIVDSVAVNDGGASDVTYGMPTLGVSYDGAPFAPGGASRIPDGVDTDTTTDWVRNDFDLAGIPGFTGTPVVGEAYNTPGTLNKLVMPQLVINEIDYNQPGTDTAEFVEIRNNGSSLVSLSGVTLELVNGNGGGAAIYDTIPLPTVDLAAGDYFVVCANAATVANCDLDDDPDTNFIQNGSPDAVGLRWNGNLIDAVSYAGDTGVPYTEGSGVGLVDDGASAGQGISRCPDGIDTNQNNVDLALALITPGTANVCADAAPEVTSTFPVDGATDFPISANLNVTFSEPVDVSGSWLSLSCSISGVVNATVSGGPISFTLDPDVNLVDGENCTLTIYAANVTDQDTNDPPDNMQLDFTIGFTPFDVCVASYTPIYDIQGSGAVAAITEVVTTQGVVVGDYEGPSPALRGFYIQDSTGDGDANTSDGIFVFNGNNDNVNLGDVVRVTGTAGEFQDQTQISSVTSIASCGTGYVAPVDVSMPFPSATYLEQYEGMLVRFPQTLYVTEHFQLGRFGQVLLSSGERLKQPTNVVAPGAPALALQAANDLNKIILDDDLQNQNPDPILFGRGGLPLSASNTLRGGDTASGIVGIMTYTWSGNAASGNAYRLRPINALGGSVPDFQPANLRPTSAPDVGGSVRVVGMNLLNFFNTFDGLPDTVDNCNNGVGGAATDCRGADTQAEFDRQWPKTVAAILAMNPDVLGVNELENDGYGPTSAIQFLVDKLNEATAPGTYAFIDADAATGQVNAMGTDAIKIALIYKPGNVTPVGQTAVLNSVAFVNGGDSEARNRPTIAQAFQVNANSAVFIVDVNHLKSKGSACDVPDAGDGQGNCNQVRVNAATELMNWLASDPTGTGDSDILLIGDYNSYAMEDPITVIKNAGFTNLIYDFLGANAYSYVFDGQWGYLDHALGSSSIVSQITGVADYHINADEPSVLDYNTDFKSAGQIISLYAPDQFRVSDHDPVIIGLEPDGRPTVTVSPASQSVQYSDPIADVTITGVDASADIPLSISTEWNVDGGSFTAGLPSGLTLSSGTCGSNACTWTLSGPMLSAPGSYTVRATVTDNDEGPTTVDINIEVTQEDARATYTGALYVSTESTSSSNASVTLAATVQDISVTSDAAGDTYPGDIRNATVTFINRDTNTPISGCTDLPVGLVNPGDLQTGTATCNWSVTISGDGQDFTVGIVVNHYYTRNSSDDNAVVVVAKPLASNFVSGGGYIVLSNSAGEIAGDAGRKSNFGFNVKYNKKGKNLQGNVNIIVRRLEADGIVHVYQIKGNVMSSLAVQVDQGTATFNGKANIQDITDPLNPISIDGNATLQIDMDDNGEPGSGDTIGITLWNKDGGLWFSNHWDGAQTVQQSLSGGNLLVH